MPCPLIARGHPLGEILLGSRQPAVSSPTPTSTSACCGGNDRRCRSISAPLAGQRMRAAPAPGSVGRCGQGPVANWAPFRSVDELLQVIRDETVLQPPPDCGSILLLDPEAGQDPRRACESAGCPFGSELQRSRAAIPRRQLAVLMSDFDVNSELQRSHDGVRSAMFVPLAHSGKTMGLIELHASARRHR